jgi:DDE family transposase
MSATTAPSTPAWAVKRRRRPADKQVIEAMQTRLDHMPDVMRVRRRTVEHIFETIKRWMGRSHFLTHRLPNFGAEMRLHVLAYNFERAIAILEAPVLMNAMRV